MDKTIAIVNQKGGVGKTTTSINLAASFSNMGRQVLLIDLDPQGNATVGSGVDKEILTCSTYHVLIGSIEASHAVVKTVAGYDLLPTNSELTAAEVSLMQEQHREQRLKRLLEPMAQYYDYLLIDCPPALNILTVNALVAADSVLIPIQCEYFA